MRSGIADLLDPMGVTSSRQRTDPLRHRRTTRLPWTLVTSGSSGHHRPPASPPGPWPTCWPTEVLRLCRRRECRS